MIKPPQETRPARWLRRLSSWIYHKPHLFIWPQALVCGLAIFYAATELQFDMSRNDLVGANKKYHQNFLRFRNEFGGQDDVVAIVESEDHEKNRQFVERLGAKLEAETNLFTDVFFKGDLKMLGSKALLFLPEADLKELARTLHDFQPFIQSFSQATNLNSLFRAVNREFQAQATQPQQNDQTDALVRALPALTRIAEQASASLLRPGSPPSPGLNALFGAGPEAEEREYLTFAHGQIYIATARPPTEELNGQSIERLRELVRQTQLEVAGVNAGITGEAVLEYDEMLQSQMDSAVATVISLILVALIFIYAYRETGRPLKATLALLLGLGFTMGFTTFAVGHLNILTVTFLPMLIGLAIDFGVHLITRYEEELRHNKTEEEGLEKAIVNTGLGIFTGCFTTAGAFLAMWLTNFKGIQEMGLITGGGMIICLFPMMTFLPALLLRGRQNVLDHQLVHRTHRRAKIEKLWLERPGVVTGITAAVTLFALVQFPKVYFDYNLLNMQSKGLASVEFDRKLINSASKSVLFGAVVANSMEEALQLENKLTNLPSVANVESIAPFLVDNPAAKLDEIRQIKAGAAKIKFAPYDRAPVNTSALRQTLFYTRTYLGNALPQVQKEGDDALLQELQRLDAALADLRDGIVPERHPNAARKLAEFQQALFRDITDTFALLRESEIAPRIKVEDLPPAIRNRFVGKTGKLLLQVYPKKNVWQRANQKEFVDELQTVDANATGTPVQLYYYTTLLKKSYENAAWYALGAISLLVFIHFRSITNVLLALLPVALGAVWMVGFMGLVGIPFNPANIMTLPLVIGIGVTNGIHILNRFAEEQNPSILAKSTGKAVLVSGLTTVAGFGSLIQAKHQGIESLGVVMSVGVITCMVAALTFLPTLLNLLIQRGWRIKRPSDSKALPSLGLEEPR